MRLNLGSGAWNPPGFTSVDLEGGDVRHDLRVFPWPFPDGAAEEILASHILEHLTRADGARFLAECARILRPGGVLRLAVPDMDRFIDCHLSGDFGPLGGYPLVDLNVLMGGGWAEPRPHWRHAYMYSWGSLAWACARAGLVPERRSFGPPHTPEYQHISLYVDARRPA